MNWTNLIPILTKVNRTGRCGRRIGEALICEGLIEFCGPRPEINYQFNCLRLTVKGLELLMDEAAFQNLLDSNGPYLAEARP